MFLLILICATDFTPPEGIIYSNNEVVSVQVMLDALAEVDVVFVGEQHDDSFAHQWELFLFQSLGYNDRVLALEMFETDVQPLLDGYLADEISEEEFLSGARPWGNYQTDYAPMVRYAHDAMIPVIAANVPRMYAAMVARGGFEAVMGEPGFENISIDSSSVSYREKFLATMDAIGDQMHGMPLDPENMYRAQLLKDAVMANSIEGQKVIFICGSFHSDYHSGIPDQITTESYLTVSIPARGEEVSSDLADFVIERPQL